MIILVFFYEMEFNTIKMEFNNVKKMKFINNINNSYLLFILSYRCHLKKITKIIKRNLV